MSIRTSISNYITEKSWTIGFSEDSVGSILSGKRPFVRWLKGSYNKGWFADPFILDANDDTVHVLVEEYVYKEKKGRISLLEVDRRTYHLKSVTPLLSLDTHLSFPAILRDESQVYIYPENGLANTLDLYKLTTGTKTKLDYVRNLAKAPFADAIISDFFGESMVFATELPNQNKNILNVYAENNGYYSKVNSIELTSNVARNAGRWFVYQGSIYRPAQDCNKRYGGAVIIQRVSQLSQYDFSFTDIARIESDNKLFTLGCHTFNMHEGLIVIDAHGYRRPKLKRFYDKLRGINEL